VTLQLPIQITNIFQYFLRALVPLHFEKGSATHVTYVLPCTGVCPSTSYLQEKLAWKCNFL